MLYMSKEWITTQEAAKLSGYHPEHLRRLIRQEKIDAQKFGIVWQIDKQSLLDYLATAADSEDGRWGAKSQADS